MYRNLLVSVMSPFQIDMVPFGSFFFSSYSMQSFSELHIADSERCSLQLCPQQFKHEGWACPLRVIVFLLSSYEWDCWREIPFNKKREEMTGRRFSALQDSVPALGVKLWPFRHAIKAWRVFCYCFSGSQSSPLTFVPQEEYVQRCFCKHWFSLFLWM